MPSTAPGNPLGRIELDRSENAGAVAVKEVAGSASPIERAQLARAGRLIAASRQVAGKGKLFPILTLSSVVQLD